MNKLASVNILTYNGQSLIGPCLDSVFKQTYPNVEVLVIDNASKDKTVRIVKKICSTANAKKQCLNIIENKKNLGFAAGHNIGIKKSRGEYVLCLNQDVILDKDFIKMAVKTIEKDKKVGAVQGKLYKLQTLNPKPQTSNIIDTTGLLMFKNRRIVNRGQGEKDNGKYNKEEEIFGVDGAASLYRRSALEDIKLPVSSHEKLRGRRHKSIPYEYFDENFFCYKEDVDLAWRMRLYGWKAVYQPKAIAYHARGAGEIAVKNPVSIIKQRKNISQFAKFYSFKNQRLMQIKNELFSLFFRHICYILPKEIASWLYILFFEKYAWKAIKNLIRQIPNSWQKRKIIMANKKNRAKEMKKWFES